VEYECLQYRKKKRFLSKRSNVFKVTLAIFALSVDSTDDCLLSGHVELFSREHEDQGQQPHVRLSEASWHLHAGLV